MSVPPIPIWRVGHNTHPHPLALLSSTMSTPSSADIQNLETAAPVYSALCCLYGKFRLTLHPLMALLLLVPGAYFVLFIVAITTIYGRAGNSYKNLKIVTVLLCVHHTCPSSCKTLSQHHRFIDLTVHFITRSVEFSRARILPQPSNEFLKWTTPLRTVERYACFNTSQGCRFLFLFPTSITTTIAVRHVSVFVNKPSPLRRASSPMD